MLTNSLPVCSSCRERVSTCARCGVPLYAGDRVRCDPDEWRPRHMHEDGCPIPALESSPVTEPLRPMGDMTPERK